ncbi:MAG: response regulator [Proteobacteria bacterium]|nr:response regulator [Pseudomonadota bacterium]
MNTLDALRQRVARERVARAEAERLLEAKSLELYAVNQRLVEAAASLEQAVRDRTTELRRARDEAIRAEAEANAQRHLAEQASEAKSLFLANMSHEIRTPVASMLGFLELLVEPGADPLQSAEWLDIVHRNAGHLLSLLDEVLDIARLEAGKMSLAPYPHAVRPFFEELVALHRQKGLASENTICLDIDSDVAETLQFDGGKVRQILVNLVANANRHTRRGRIRIHVGKQAGLLRATVSDTGAGIAERDLQRIWEPFEQGRRGEGWREGAGLGLAISRRLAERIGGRMGLKSEPGRGTEVWLEFPLVEVRSVDSVTKPASSTTHPALKHARVLIVDDLSDSRKLLAHHLSRAGADVHCAEDGFDALRLLREGQAFDVMLLDLQMPQFSGQEVLAELRAVGGAPPVLVLTADATTATREGVLALGATALLVKPCPRDQLLQAISAACSTSMGARSTVAVPDADELPAEMLELFHSELDLRLEGVSTAFENDDLEALGRIAHKIAGTGTSYGFPALTAAARGLQAAAEQGDDIEHAVRRLLESRPRTER